MWLPIALLILLALWLLKSPKHAITRGKPPPVKPKRKRAAKVQTEPELAAPEETTPASFGAANATAKGIHLSEEEFERMVQNNPDIKKALEGKG